MSSTYLELRAQIEDRSNYINLIKLIAERYNLDPSSKTTLTNIRAFLAPLSVDKILERANSLEEANRYIVDLYGKTTDANRVYLPDELDNIKDYFVKVINTPGDEAVNLSKPYNKIKSSFVGSKESFSDIGSLLRLPLPERIEVVKYLNYSSLFRDEYIIIDSRYQNTVNVDNTKLVFSLLTNTKTKSDNGGVIVGSRIQDIVEIEVFPFTIPYKPIYVTFYNKITLTINEWTVSSFEAYEGGQFHFNFDIEKVDNNLIYLKPINNIYRFAEPVNQIDNFTISFGAVLPKIRFDSDRMKISYIDYTNEYGLFVFDTPHNIVTGDLVYITGFTTPDPARDVEVISEVNRSEGHSIVKRNNYSFIINVNLSLLRREFPVGSGIFPIDNLNQNLIIYFASKRIQIQMRLRYLTTYSRSQQ